jgi:hypothetical protein
MEHGKYVGVRGEPRRDGVYLRLRKPTLYILVVISYLPRPPCTDLPGRCRWRDRVGGRFHKAVKSSNVRRRATGDGTVNGGRYASLLRPRNISYSPVLAPQVQPSSIFFHPNVSPPLHAASCVTPATPSLSGRRLLQAPFDSHPPHYWPPSLPQSARVTLARCGCGWRLLPRVAFASTHLGGRVGRALGSLPTRCRLGSCVQQALVGALRR